MAVTASFSAAARQVLWLAAFFAGLAACAVGVTYPPQSSAFVLPDSCTAGVTIYSSLYMSCFSAVTTSAVQASAVSISMLLLGSGESLDRLTPSSSMFCRYLLLVAAFFCLLSFLGIICILDFIIFVKVGKFACLSLTAKLIVVAGDALAAVCGVAFFAAGSYVAIYCN